MINKYVVDYDISKNLGLDFLQEYEIFPIQQQELFILVATSSIAPNELLLSTFFTKPIKFITTTKEDIKWHIDNFNTLFEIYDCAKNAIKNNKQDDINNSFIVSMIDNIIKFAISVNASDIHIESLKNSVAVRYRIDGTLQLISTFNYEMFGLLSTVLKLFAGLDISQSRLPQDGRFSKIFDRKEYDFRISTIPIINGESLVIRVLDNNNATITLDKIGFDRSIFKAISKVSKSSQGLILVTGPTGSGKTTTLYSMLNSINTTQKKIMTVEDPVEYNLDGIQQIHINEDIGLNYTQALKSILRQDPDIIMIGEIRDEEALKIAIQASLTGHLVIATLHTNNAPDTINRLLDLNAQPFLIASTLKAIISQRLVRKLCDNCKNKNEAIGCSQCNATGYSGRINICELLECDKKVSEMIAKKASISDIVKYSKTKGYVTLEENCLEKIKENKTSMDEFYSKIEML